MNTGWPYFTKCIPDKIELSVRFFVRVGVLRDF